MKKGDIGMAKHLSKEYGSKGWAINYPVSAIWNKILFCQDAWCYIPTSLPPEPSTILCYFELNSGIGPVASLAEEGL